MGRFIPEIVADSVRFDNSKRDAPRTFFNQIVLAGVLGVAGYFAVDFYNATTESSVSPWVGSTLGLGGAVVLIVLANLGMLSRERRSSYRAGALDQSDTVEGRSSN